MKYKLNKKGIIEKSDYTTNYKKEDFINAVAKAETSLREYEAQQGVYIAKYENIAHFHPQVLKVSEEDKNAIWLYHENYVKAKQVGSMIKDLKKGIKDIKSEMKEIEKQTGLKFE